MEVKGLKTALFIGIGIVLGAGAALTAIKYRQSEKTPSADIKSTPGTASIQKKSNSAKAKALKKSLLAKVGKKSAKKLEDLINAALAQEPEDKQKRYLLHLIDEADDEQVPALLGLSDDMIPESHKREFDALAILKWASFDPLNALAYAQAEANPGTRMHYIQSVIPAWVINDQDAVFNWIKQEAASQQRILYIKTALKSLAKLNPERAFDLSFEHLNKIHRRSIYQTIFQAWAKKSPAAAAAKLKDLTYSEKQNIYHSLVYEWAKTDLPAAKRWVNSLTGKAKDHATGALASAWGRRDPQAAQQYVLSLNSPLKKQALSALTYAWAKTDPAAVIEWMKGLKKDDRDLVIGPLSYTWVKYDLASVKSYLLSLSKGKSYNNAFKALLNDWSSHDPKSAMAFAEKLPINSNRTQVIITVAQRWSHSDPDTLIAWLKTINNSMLKNKVLDQVYFTWARQDPEGALQEFSSLSKGYQREYMVALP